MSAMEEAIAAAKQLEVDGRTFYLEAADNASSEATRRMFASLAEDEAHHLEWLEKLAPGVAEGQAPSAARPALTGVASSREANEALYAKLKDVFASASSAPPGEAGEGTSTDIEAIDVAAGMEEKSIAAYAEWARKGEKGETEEVRKLGSVLVGQERFHRQLLDNAREYLQGPGDWFMAEERWNFEGG